MPVITEANVLNFERYLERMNHPMPYLPKSQFHSVHVASPLPDSTLVQQNAVTVMTWSVDVCHLPQVMTASEASKKNGCTVVPME